MIQAWVESPADLAAASALTASAGLHPVLARILAGRGYDDPGQIADFLRPTLAAMPDPFLLKGMERTVERLCQARQSAESVCIYGDYDVDGLTSTALLKTFLADCGIMASYFIPNRFDDGYGLNGEAIRRIVTSGVSLIITVDCGIVSFDEARLCRDLGADLIVTDHHTPRDTVPDACAVINPHQPGCTYPYKTLAGVGVAFNLAVALRSRLRMQGLFEHRPEPDVRQLLDLVALGTIADVVPLTGQNRLYVQQGLRLLKRGGRPGIAALKRVAGVEGDISCGQVAFRLAPRLNAAGRMESAVPGVELLITDDHRRAAVIAGELDAANSERQAVERSLFEDAARQVEQSGIWPACRSIVLASPVWHQGVIGIVASRMVERYYRPTILIAVGQDGEGRGSGRSIPGFDLLAAIDACRDTLSRFGGHRQAAGVALSASQVAEFADAFEAEARKRLGDDHCQPCLTLDCRVEPDEVTAALAEQLKQLEPFGAGNPEPVLMMNALDVTGRRVVGEHHLRLHLKRDGRSFTAIGFRMAGLTFGDTVDLAFVPEITTWNGTSRLQLKIKDIRTAE